LNGKATLLACQNLVKHLFQIVKPILNTPSVSGLKLKDGFVFYKNEKTHLDWQTLVIVA
jgi:hypothetical protein